MAAMAPRISIILRLLIALVLLGFVFGDSSDNDDSTGKPHGHPCFLYEPQDSDNCTGKFDPSKLSTNGTTNGIKYDIYKYDAEKWVSWVDMRPDTDTPEKNYFRFTQENLNASKVDDFYAQWTIERQMDPVWNVTGEWKLFNSDFANNLNYECGTGFKHCIDQPTLANLQVIYPGDKNRALVRRIYFVLKKYELLHSYTEEIMEMFEVTHSHLAGYVPALVTTFTQQEDRDKIKKCELLQQIINEVVSTAVSVVSSMVGGAISSVTSAGMKMAWGNPKFGKLDTKAIEDIETTLVAGVTKNIASDAEKSTAEGNLRISMSKGVRAVKEQLDSLAPTLKFDADALLNEYMAGREKAKPMNFDWFSLAWKQLFNYDPVVKAVDYKMHMNDLNIEGGMGHGFLCSEFEGDFKSNNAANRDKLTTGLTGIFENIRQQTQKTFGAIYDGVIIEPGQPSLMARMMSNRDWDGEGSALNNLREPVNLQLTIEKAMIKNIASNLRARGYNYMKCTHHPQGAKLCRDAKSNDKKIGLSRFCPEPETDPNLICQLGKWHFGVQQQHEIEMIGIKDFSTFLENKYNFTLAEFQKEAWDNYKTCGNNCKETNWEDLAFGGRISSKWTIPTCVNDGVHLNDFFTNQGAPNNVLAWGFPSICGDFHSNETQYFMDALHIGLESKVYQGRDTSELWEDRIPRELGDLDPYENYMALCKHGVRFPRHGEYPNKKTSPIKHITGPAVKFKYYHWGSDVDCDKVANATAGLDEYDANEWFCFSDLGKRIQDAQRDHVDMAHIPHTVLFGAKKKCEKWGWQGGGIRHGRPEHGKGSKTWKAERSSRESKWKPTSTSSSSKPTGKPTVFITTTIRELITTTVYTGPSTSIVETCTRTNSDGCRRQSHLEWEMETKKAPMRE